MLMNDSLQMEGGQAQDENITEESNEHQITHLSAGVTHSQINNNNDTTCH